MILVGASLVALSPRRCAKREPQMLSMQAQYTSPNKVHVSSHPVVQQ
jgi:hypothetical protein